LEYASDTTQFTSWQETLRYPEGLFDNATSQNELITPVVDNQRLSIANRLYNLLVYYDNFTQFSNEAWLEDHESADSLEALHDIIHGVTGKDGHMTYLDFSSYDGLFWLHHCMIDRIFSIYQYLHPDTYVEPMAAISPTYTIAAGSIQDADSRELCRLKKKPQN
jgi:tyrosinase